MDLSRPGYYLLAIFKTKKVMQKGDYQHNAGPAELPFTKEGTTSKAAVFSSTTELYPADGV